MKNNTCDGYGVIYKATNKTNGKCYIGQTVRKLKERICGHYSCAKSYNYKFANALKKYEKDDWQWEVISYHVPYSQLDGQEISFIKQYNPEYNSSPGGRGALRGRMNPSKREEVKAKISKAMTGKKYSEERKAKIREMNVGEKPYVWKETYLSGIRKDVQE